MSIEAVAWALSQPVEHSSAKFVLVVLANHADSDGICWPSIQSISDSTAQDRKTVIANLKRLVEMGWITDTGMRKGTTNQVPVYRLNSTKNGTVEQSQKREPYKAETVPFFPMNSTVFPWKQSQKRDTEPSVNRQQNHQGKKRQRGTSPRLSIGNPSCSPRG